MYVCMYVCVCVCLCVFVFACLCVYACTLTFVLKIGGGGGLIYQEAWPIPDENPITINVGGPAGIKTCYDTSTGCGGADGASSIVFIEITAWCSTAEAADSGAALTR